MNCNNYNTIKVTAGNAFSLLLPLKEKHYVSEQPIEEVINAALLTDVQVLLNNEEWSEFELGEDGVLVHFPSTLSKGVYNIEVTAKYGGIAIRAAYFQCLSIVSWSYQSDAENYIPTSPLVADAAFVISVNGDEELTALKEQYRNAIAATEAEKAEYARKVAELNGVAQESTSQQILNEVQNIDIDSSDLAKEVTSQEILQKVEAIAPDSSGQQAVSAAINARGGSSQPTDSLYEMSQEILAIPMISTGGLEWVQGTEITKALQVISRIRQLTKLVDEDTVSLSGNSHSSIIYSDLPYLEQIAFPELAEVIVSSNDNYETSRMYNNFLRNCPILTDVSLPKLESLYVSGSSSLGNNAFDDCPLLRTISLPKLKMIGVGGAGSNLVCSLFKRCTSLESISIATEVEGLIKANFGDYNPIANMSTFSECPNLIDITLGRQINGDGILAQNIALCKSWNPTTVLADASKVAQMNANIRDHIVANLFAGSFTFYFNTAMQPYLEQATLDAFAAKGWTLAYA